MSGDLKPYKLMRRFEGLSPSLQAIWFVLLFPYSPGLPKPYFHPGKHLTCISTVHHRFVIRICWMHEVILLLGCPISPSHPLCLSAEIKTSRPLFPRQVLSNHGSSLRHSLPWSEKPAKRAISMENSITTADPSKPKQCYTRLHVVGSCTIHIHSDLSFLDEVEYSKFLSFFLHVIFSSKTFGACKPKESALVHR